MASWQTINAINIAMNYKNLYKGAEVLWDAYMQKIQQEI